MKLLDAGEVLPSEMVLSLVATKLASRECQKSGWVLEGVGTAAAGVDELEEAIVMATEVRVITRLRFLCMEGSPERGKSRFNIDLLKGVIGSTVQGAG